MDTADSRCPRCSAEVPREARFCPSCGNAATRLAPGQILDGKYEILDKLAEGGMGQVYRARHIHLDEIRIIKVTKPDPLGEGLEPLRFQEEARLATTIRHPNVAALYDFSRLPDGSFYMVWEFIDGVTLEEWIRRNGAMPLPQAIEVARQVLMGLGEIHLQGIVHRDLAPDNIMLRRGARGELRAKIIDLGIAKRVAAEARQMTSTGMFVGKLKYCSPEQAGALPRGETVDGRSDLYSFGVVLYEMLTGRPPFEAETPEAYLGQHLHTPPPPLDTSRLPAEVGPPLADILKQALQKNRNRRFRDAEEFRRALERLKLPEGDSAALTVAAGPRRAAWPVGAVAAALILLAAAATYLMIHRWPRPAPETVPTPPALAASAPPSTPAPGPGAAEDVPAARVVESPPIPPRGSSRTVADPSEAGVVRAPAEAKPGLNPSPAPEPTDEEAVESVPDLPARMDGESAQRFRRFVKHWSTLPVERQSNQAMYLARGASLFVAAYPDDPLSADLRRRLPGTLKELAEKELDALRPRVALRFYEAYRRLDFAPAAPDLDHRFAALPPSAKARRPPGG
ncbi:MAG TPA: protein kinase [Thermoanaerobaculia bacterium]|nr:protein kinase [Thermoanaerobaculia bacterium]